MQYGFNRSERKALGDKRLDDSGGEPLSQRVVEDLSENDDTNLLVLKTVINYQRGGLSHLTSYPAGRNT